MDGGAAFVTIQFNLYATVANYKEYEEGVTNEAMLVKDLDRFDMIFQAWEYEKGIIIIK